MRTNSVLMLKEVRPSVAIVAGKSTYVARVGRGVRSQAVAEAILLDKPPNNVFRQAGDENAALARGARKSAGQAWIFD